MDDQRHLYPVHAERSVIAGLLTQPTEMDRISHILLPSDLSSDDLRGTYAAMVDLWERGHALDVVEIHQHPQGPPMDFLAELVATAPSVSNLTSYADTIVKAARLRRIAVGVGQVSTSIMAGNVDNPDEAAELVRRIEQADAEDFRSGEGPLTVSMEEFRETVIEEEEQHEWLVPGLLRRRWRMILAGEEGIGKMVFLRQIGHSMAAGVHPLFASKSVKPCRVLLVDLENPHQTIVEQSALVSVYRDLVAEAGERLRIHSNEAGMNILEHGDRRKFERLLQEARPDLLIVGPLYKLARRRDGRSDWDADAMDVINFIDSIRVRYHCAVLMEHHLTGDKDRAKGRTPNQAGSAMFRRWPEMSFSMIMDPDSSEDDPRGMRVDLHRYRRSRNQETWPRQLRRRDGVSTGHAWEAIL